MVLTNGAKLAVAPAYRPAPINLGALDTTFGDDGTVQVPLADSSGASGAAIQPDGEILISGGYSIARLNPDGTLDVTFGEGGIVNLPYGARAVTLQPDGKIIIGGVSTIYEFAVQRLNADGSVDRSFGVDGAALANFYPIAKYLWEVAVQPDGKILASGFTGSSGGDFLLVRFNADRTLDQSFGNAGIVFTDVGSNTDFAADMVVRPDGRIILVGGSGGRFAVVQYLPNGSLDTTFGSSGKVTTDFGIGSSARGASLLPDGRLVVSGPAGNLDYVVLARYLTDGSLDRSFGLLGLIKTGVGRITDNPQMALQADGGVIVAAESIGSQRGFRLIRYTPSGDVDESYNFPLVNIGGSSFAAPGEVLIQSDGKIVVAGRAPSSGNAHCLSEGPLNHGRQNPHLRLSLRVSRQHISCMVRR